MHTHDKYSHVLLLNCSLVFQNWKSRLGEDNIHEYTFIFIKKTQDKTNHLEEKLQAPSFLFSVRNLQFKAALRLRLKNQA